MFAGSIKKTMAFCGLILYPDTLMKWLIVSTSFMINVLGFLKYIIPSSASRDNLTFSYLCALLLVLVGLLYSR